MYFEWFISSRYLKAKRKNTFVSVITLISVGGIMVGVMALIIVLSVMGGFEQNLKQKIMGMNAHILLLSYGDSISPYREVQKKLTGFKGIEGVMPFVYSQVMVKSPYQVVGAVLRGIDPDAALKVMNLREIIKTGSLEGLGQEGPGKGPGILIGRELAKHMGVSLGQSLEVIAPFGRLTPLGQVPRTLSFRVAGIFESGMYEYDSTLAFISLGAAQSLLGLGDRVTGLEIKVKEIYRAQELAVKIKDLMGYPYWTKDWMQMNKNLFSALKLEKVAMFVILTLIVLVAAFNIVSTLIMVVMEKNKDIAILKSMGATSRHILRIFMLEGLIVGALGTLSGLGFGLLICRLLKHYPLVKLPMDVYYISTLPVNVDLTQVSLIVAASMGMSFMATWYPAWHASRLDPAEVLRYE